MLEIREWGSNREKGTHTHTVCQGKRRYSDIAVTHRLTANAFKGEGTLGDVKRRYIVSDELKHRGIVSDALHSIGLIDVFIQPIPSKN